jgi:hypothetical protein
VPLRARFRWQKRAFGVVLRGRGLERFASAQIEVHGAGQRTLGLGDGLHDRAAQAGEGGGRGVGQAEIEEGAGVVAVQLHLVDGLRGVSVLHVERAIGGEHHERQVRERGFDDRREVVGSGAARRAQKRAGAAGDARVAQRQKGRRTLVDDRPHRDAGQVLGSPRERRGARARAEPKVGDAGFEQATEQKPSPLADQVRVARRAGLRRQARRHTGGKLQT